MTETKIIPIFPLDLVLFPRQELPLRVFEPRYKQLVDDCMLGDVVEGKYKKAVAFLGGAGPLGRGLALPPKTPGFLTSPLRAAFDSMNADKVYGAELKNRKLRLLPTSGAKLQEVVESSMSNTTPAVIKQVSQLIFGGNS